MSETGETQFNKDGLEKLAAEAAADREAEMEEREREIDQRMDQHVKRQMAEISLDLVESDTDDEDDENAGVVRPRGQDLDCETPKNTKHKLPAHFLTSTPHAPNFNDLHDDQNHEESRFLHASDRGTEQIEILYEARGHEIERLRAEVEKLRDENSSDNRRLRHEVALLKADNEQLKIKLEQSEDTFEAAAEENRVLRNDIDLMKTAMLKQDKNKAELISRAEDSENHIQSLQNQLIELQNKDTILKAREHHDAVVSSLKERHESEIYNLQHEIDRLTAINTRLEKEKEIIRAKMNETIQNNECLMVEKSDRIEELSQKLDSTQKKLNTALLANSNQEFLKTAGDPIKEICDLKSKLAALTQNKIDQDVHIRDLMDELAVLKVRDDSRSKNTESNNKELSNLKALIRKKDSELAAMNQHENQLMDQNKRLKNDVAHLSSEIQKISNREKEAIHSADEISEHQIAKLNEEIMRLRDDLEKKSEEYLTQESKIKQLIIDWEDNAEQIKANHGKDRMDLEEVRSKYKDLKRKVRGYQKHRQKEREHYLEENRKIREAFENILRDYKEKMESAVEFREKEVENELLSLKRQFDFELERIRLINPDTFSNEEDLPTVSTSIATKESGGGGKSRRRRASTQLVMESTSDEENNLPSSNNNSRSSNRAEQMAKLFANAALDLKDKLKRPPRLPLNDFNLPSKE